MQTANHNKPGNRKNGEKGSIIIVAALSAAMLMAFTGLALECDLHVLP